MVDASDCVPIDEGVTFKYCGMAFFWLSQYRCEFQIIDIRVPLLQYDVVVFHDIHGGTEPIKSLCSNSLCWCKRARTVRDSGNFFTNLFPNDGGRINSHEHRLAAVSCVLEAEERSELYIVNAVAFGVLCYKLIVLPGVD